MNLVSIPANPVPEDVVTGMLKTPDGVSLRFARWAPPPGRKGTVCLFPGPRRIHREIFRDRARSARARFRGGRARLARAGRLAAAVAQSAQRLCAPLRRLRHRSRDLHARGRAAGLSAAGVRARAFDGRDRADPRRASGASLVRSHGAAGAADRFARHAPLDDDAHRGARDADGRAGRRLCAGRRRLGDAAASVHRQSADLRSRCATRAMSRCWKRSRRSRSAGRRWRGRIPRSG